MNIDSCVRIGTSHQLCEDYIKHESNIVVLSDGCSSSKDTDIGSRILVLSVLEYINLLDIYKSDIFGESIINIAKNIINSLGISKQCLDATLSIMYRTGDGIINILMYGDGFILIKTIDGLVMHRIKYTHNAPFYLSYRIDENRKKQYIIESENHYQNIESINETGIISKGTRSSWDHSAYLDSKDIQENKILSIAICSDGLESFVKKDTGGSISPYTIAKMLMEFKNTNGEFVKRRVTKVFKDLAKENIFATDDFSMGVMTVEGGSWV